MDTKLSFVILHLMNQEFVKLDRFDGQNYTHWADKFKFMFHVLKLAYVLDLNFTPIPADPISEAGKTTGPKNSLSDRLYDLYVHVNDPTKLWSALDLKYKTHEEGTNKYLVSKYLEFQMVDGKPIMDQVHEIHFMVNMLNTLPISMPELFRVEETHIKDKRVKAGLSVHHVSSWGSGHKAKSRGQNKKKFQSKK
uniref:Uncharacterized protein n=1 Tax=Lactuca sativa TaxID=4236 RepID=A0A9R1XFE4_LACSA|nr:hypothetical protein LSAT_V11C500251290 [Lactuca sativa]